MSNAPYSPPPRLVQAATVLTGALLAFNIVFDALSPDYQGYEVTFGLMTLFGGLLKVTLMTKNGEK